MTEPTTPLTPITKSAFDELQEKKEEILIAVISQSGKITAQLAEFLIRASMETFNQASPYRFSTALVVGVSPVEYARNKSVKILLEQAKSARRAWLWDDDMIPPPNAMDLLRIDADLVTGVYFNFGKSDYGGPGTLGVVYPEYNPVTCKWTSLRNIGQGVIDVEGSGGGCLLVKRHVFEDPRMHLPTAYTDVEGRSRDANDEGDDNAAPAVFRAVYTPTGRVHVSEDLDFTHRAKQFGYSLKCDTNVVCGHLKSLDTLGVLQFGQYAHDEGVKRGKENGHAQSVGGEAQAGGGQEGVQQGADGGLRLRHDAEAGLDPVHAEEGRQEAQG